MPAQSSGGSLHPPRKYRKPRVGPVGPNRYDPPPGHSKGQQVVWTDADYTAARARNQSTPPTPTPCSTHIGKRSSVGYRKIKQSHLARATPNCLPADHPSNRVRVSASLSALSRKFGPPTSGKEYHNGQ